MQTSKIESVTNYNVAISLENTVTTRSPWAQPCATFD